MSICIRCKQEFESEHSDYVCDDCHLLSIRKRIDGNTSYPTHIADLRFLMKRYDEERAAHNEHMTELCQLEKENRKLREQLQRTVELYQFECRRRIAADTTDEITADYGPRHAERVGIGG